MAHQVSRLAQKARERIKNPNSRAEAVYQSPIPIAIFFKSLLPFLKQFKDSVGGDGLLELLGKGITEKGRFRFGGRIRPRNWRSIGG